MKIAVIGHPIKLNKIEEVLKKINSSLSIIRIDIIGAFSEKDAENLLDIQKKVQIIIVAGRIDYMILSKKIILSCVNGYIARDITTLYKMFLELTLKKYNIKEISIDGYSMADIEEVYNELFREGRGDYSVYNYNKFELDHNKYIDDLVEFHLENYRNNNVSCCLTSMSFAYERLKELDIPVFLISSSSEVIRNTYEKLRLEYLIREKSDYNIIYITVEIDKHDDSSLFLENDYQMVKEQINVTEYIYLFAHRLKAAVEVINLSKFNLITNMKLFESETSNFKNIELINEVEKHTMSTISMGVGYGYSAREAKHHAGMGIDKAKLNGGRCCYIIFNKQNIKGPIYSTKKPEEEREIDNRFLEISKATELSTNTISKLHLLISKHKKDTFTIMELADLYGSSTRTMYRIIDKLEQNNYAVSVGKKIVDSTGRPSRLIKIKI